MEAHKRGFTLLELMVVIIIIGILATLAISGYSTPREHAVGQEAKANLKLMAVAENIYKMEVRTYYPSSGTESNIANINTNLKFFLTKTNWDYSVTGGASSFTAYAQRVAGFGTYSNCLYTLAHDDADGEADPSSATDCP